MAILRVVAPAPQLEPTSRLRSAMSDFSFLQSDSVLAIRPVQRYSEVFGLEAEAEAQG